MVTYCVEGCSNQSRLNRNVSYHEIPDQERKDIMNAWVRAIARSIYLKLSMCLLITLPKIHLMKDSFDESQELKRCLLCGNLKYILKPDAVSSLFPNGKAVNKSGSGSVHLFICSKLSVNKNI